MQRYASGFIVVRRAQLAVLQDVWDRCERRLILDEQEARRRAPVVVALSFVSECAVVDLFSECAVVVTDLFSDCAVVVTDLFSGCAVVVTDLFSDCAVVVTALFSDCAVAFTARKPVSQQPA